MIRTSRKSIFALFALAALFLLAGCTAFTNPDPSAVPTQVEPATAIPTLAEQSDSTATAVETSETEPADDPAGTSDAIAPSSDLDVTFQPFWQAWGLLHRYFVDQPLDDTALIQGAISGLNTFAELPEVSVSEETAREFAEAADTPNDLEDLSLPFWQAWVAAGSGSDVPLMRAALTGMVDSLGDQHTSYMDPDQFFQANIPLDGSYEGIGAWVDPNDEYLTIVSPMPGSPAEAAGLNPGDQIIQVDGEDMTGIDGNLVIRRVLGPSGSEVTLTIRREGVEDFNVVIQRAVIVIPSVTGEILEGTNIAYVQLFQFGETTGAELRTILEELIAQEPDGLVFDLRNNGGGLLSTAVEIASEFIGDGVVLYEVYGDGSSDAYEALSGGVATDIPLVVLINEGSASASEIVAGAIQDYNRAPLVGATSFGKGSVQNWLPLADEGAIRITIARWYTPKERLIHEIGLTPDVPVELTEEDFAAGLDPQLNAAIDLLTQN